MISSVETLPSSLAVFRHLWNYYKCGPFLDSLLAFVLLVVAPSTLLHVMAVEHQTVNFTTSARAKKAA